MFRKLAYLIAFALALAVVQPGVGAGTDPSLMGWWTLDGHVLDVSGNDRHGTLNGSPGFGPGVFGEALELDGDDFVSIDGYKGIVGTDPWSVTAWIRSNDVGDHRIVVNWGSAPNGQRIELRTLSGSGTLRANHGGGNIQANTPVTDGEWHHVAMTINENSTATYPEWILYVDGQDDTIPTTDTDTPLNIIADVDFTIGSRATHSDRFWVGSIDDVRLYDKVLTPEEVKQIMESGGGEPFPFAARPNPADDALLEATWATISWSPGALAVSHDIYLGDNFDDVHNGSGDTFVANQAVTSLIVGFPGFPVPGGLVHGTTYYWRVDEVNEADPNSPWKGEIWSFTVPPKTAYNPSPADGAKFADPNVVLTWVAGFDAKLHTAYFGDNFDDVNSAAGGMPLADAAYVPGTLELEKVYYWRVDQFDGAETHKGEIWSFTTTKAGGGLKAEYFNNTLLSGEPVVTRVDPEIDFNWSNGDVPGENSPEASINVNNFGARWTGELEVDLTDSYVFSINANNGFRLWLDGEPIVNYWDNPTTSTRQSNPIELIGGKTYSVRMDYSEGDDVAIAQLFWQSGTRQEQIIPSGALQPLSRAGDPSPYNGAMGVTQVITPTWRPSETASSHQVYFGTDAEAVKNATAASPEYKGSKALGAETLDPGKLAWQTTYYWRVDEVDNTNSPVAGKVWSFTTGDFLLIEDFESYNDLNPDDPGSNRIFAAWIDGFGTTTNGALVGNDVAPFMELSTVHGGFQSLPYSYDNSLKTSEAMMTLAYPRDWTEEGVTRLSLWFRGSTTNAAERMYVALNGNEVVYHDDPDAAQIGRWTEWVTDLQVFASQGVDLTNVNTIAIGFGTKGSPAAGGTGQMFFDDIRLQR
ncbi:MAG: hypothetical protein ISS70_15550 [Phycisphaerae bacterium]|nr:hypothetical protein [Phycisphaerae bacterium]